jgi:hypothetical protein
MVRFESIDIRNLSSKDYGFDVETMVARIIARVPADHLNGLYQVALLDSRGTREKTRWLGVYSAKDRRHTLIELYLEPILASRARTLDKASGHLISELLIALVLYHQIGVHYAAVHFPRQEGWARLFNPTWYSRLMVVRNYNPLKLMVYFPLRLVRSWRSSGRHEVAISDVQPRTALK